MLNFYMGITFGHFLQRSGGSTDHFFFAQARLIAPLLRSPASAFFVTAVVFFPPRDSRIFMVGVHHGVRVGDSRTRGAGHSNGAFFDIARVICSDHVGCESAIGVTRHESAHFLFSTSEVNSLQVHHHTLKHAQCMFQERDDELAQCMFTAKLLNLHSAGL